MQSFAIVGYTYTADIYCPDCIGKQLSANYPDALQSWRFDYVTTESDLNRAANLLELERMDEHTFDSDQFPKVIFADSECGEHCGNCHKPLVERESNA